MAELRRLLVWLEGCQPNAPCGSVAIVDLPLSGGRDCCFGSCRSQQSRRVMVTVTEVEPGSSPSSASEPRVVLPASYPLRGGRQDEQGCVSFGLELRGRHVEASLAKGWLLRFEVHDEGDARWKPPIAFAEIEVEDLARKSQWWLLLSDPSSCEAVYGTPPRDFEQPRPGHPDPSHVRRPAFLGLRTKVIVGNIPDSVPIELDSPAAVTPKDGGSMSSFEVSSALAEGQAPSDEPRLTGSHLEGQQPRWTGPPERPLGAARRQTAMLITRGTRGDVQPFAALARGLVLHKDCDVIVVTELCWKRFIKAAGKGLRPGSLRFRPSGGDTTQRVNADVAKLALQWGQHFDSLQALMFSRSEVEFFTSEGCFFHWAWEMRPDFLVFGFLLTHIAMIISEALEIPIVGFSLQPARQIEPRTNPQTVMDEVFGPVREVMNGPQFISVLQQVMERIPDRFTLNDMRASRGLAPCPKNILLSNKQCEELRAQKVPVIVPISPLALGAQAQQLESEGMTLTDFIFLRLGTDSLDAELSDFILQARRDRRRVVAMTFSSMPVGEGKMLDIAAEICRHGMPSVDPGQENQRHHPAVIALCAGQPEEKEVSPTALRLVQEKRLLVLRRPVPFGALFPEVDAAILHGGLGVTSEALIAGLPVVTSGILLMDQRYWAARLFELGCGSEARSLLWLLLLWLLFLLFLLFLLLWLLWLLLLLFLSGCCSWGGRKASWKDLGSCIRVKVNYCSCCRCSGVTTRSILRAADVYVAVAVHFVASAVGVIILTVILTVRVFDHSAFLP
ncbi:unnamed protein product [Polarella glacialis]|uniref:Sterol 3-beta-glucosyltransferase n=2 Tax=Polarella glacialis TaxID=89957 RepID=A0A813HR07_POLGL|nr:unnamed protein product [Polarella glacialis]